MCGGGKRGYTPPPDDSAQRAAQQAEIERQARAEEATRAEEARIRDENQWRSDADARFNSVRSYADRRSTELGLDNDAYASLVNDVLDARRGMALMSPVDAGLSNDIVEGSIGRLQNVRRQRFTNDVDRFFTPNLANTWLPDTADDRFIDSILGRQRDEARLSLDRAKARGNLDARGYEAALSSLGEMERAGRATAQGLGGAVLQRYRTGLSDIGNEARSRAGSFTFGGSFDPNEYITRAQSYKTDRSGMLEGDVTAALSGQKFFDVGDILARGGQAQGAVNPRTSAAALLTNQQRKEAERGLGEGGSTF